MTRYSGNHTNRTTGVGHIIAVHMLRGYDSLTLLEDLQATVQNVQRISLMGRAKERIYITLFSLEYFLGLEG